MILFCLFPACVELYQFVSGSFKHHSQIQRSTHQSSPETCEYSSARNSWKTSHLFLVMTNYIKKKKIIVPVWHIYINNGLFLQLYVNSRYAKPRFKKFGFEILDTGNMYLIRSPAGLKIQWFHTTGMMVIEMDSYNNRLSTMGLCGTNPLTTDYMDCKNDHVIF